MTNEARRKVCFICSFAFGELSRFVGSVLLFFYSNCSFLLLATNPYYFLFLNKKKVNKEPSPKGELANTFKK
jgi:hypothetical protein